MEKAERIFLISCVAGKKPNSAPAAELYTSVWFTKARGLVEATGAPWFILSAEYGLVAPDSVIASYECTLNKMSAADRRTWADRVRLQMEMDLPTADEIVILAGQRYRENLVSWLRLRYAKVNIPMQGLGIGKQLQWMDNASANGS
jgi:hypothetical protein